ncbi:MAG: GGDEF domain-containing protein [Cypionkella sp.]
MLTIAGTALCMVAAVAIDSFSWSTGTWRWGSDPWNNFLIPGLVAPPLLFALLSQMRQLALAHRELLTVASTDSLTNVLNRRAYTAIVEGYLAALDGQTRDGALLVIDVDFFKAVNDRFGHDKGDEALALIASTIKTTLRPGDIVARMGGEEFSVFLPRTTLDDARAAGERIRREIAAHALDVSGQAVGLTASIGGIVFPETAPFLELYRAADQQMYLAKRRGRNQVAIDTRLAA